MSFNVLFKSFILTYFACLIAGILVVKDLYILAN